MGRQPHRASPQSARFQGKQAPTVAVWIGLNCRYGKRTSNTWEAACLRALERSSWRTAKRNWFIPAAIDPNRPVVAPTKSGAIRLAR